MPTPTKNPRYGYTYGECVCGHPIDATGTVCGSEQYEGTCPGPEEKHMPCIITITEAAHFIENRWPEIWPTLDTLQRLAVAADFAEAAAKWHEPLPSWEIADEYRRLIGDNLLGYANTMVASFANRI